MRLENVSFFTGDGLGGLALVEDFVSFCLATLRNFVCLLY